MKSGKENRDKELYRQLRRLPWEQLWNGEARRFNDASPQERKENVAVVRAVGVVFSESGPSGQREEVKQWFVRQLNDPCEKVRRYAVAALPKIGAGAETEAQLLSLLRTAHEPRELKFVARALGKVGAEAVLETAEVARLGLLAETEQKIKAGIARRQRPSAVRFNAVLSDFAGLKIHLRGRRGLESVVRDEADEFVRRHGKFHVEGVGPGLVVLSPRSPFSLADIYKLRCFGTAGFVPSAPVANVADSLGALASVIASPASLNVFRAFTEGAIRYRLNFVDKGHQRAGVRLLAGKVYALRPEILNDASNVTWTVDIHPNGRDGHFVELRPNLTPDPRFYYRRRDVPAASHPQLAACMARLAGRVPNEIIWDPFCGSGLELIESALLGGVTAIHGTDLSAQAIAIARDNFAAARAAPVTAAFCVRDFRHYAGGTLKRDSISLIITNPPLGMRVPIKDLRGLFGDLFKAAAKVLRAGGRLIFANPLSKSEPPPEFELQYRQPVDFGGFDCRVEKYIKR